MYTETEIKLPIQDLDQAVRKIEDLQAQIVVARHMEDNFLFDQSDERLAKEGMLLRLRTISNAGAPQTETRAILTFKGASQVVDGVKHREEIECEITGAHNLEEIFTRIGFRTRFRYQKYRTIYGLPDVQIEICVDETPVGNFFELEGEILRIHEFATRLGYNRDDYITQSYATIYYRWCQKTGSKEPHMLFPGS